MKNKEKVADDLDTAAAILRGGLGGRKHVALADSVAAARKELFGELNETPVKKPRRPVSPAMNEPGTMEGETN